MAVLSGPKILNAMSGASLGDSYLTAGNLTLRAWQALVQANVINLTTTTPPATPNNGDTYIVASGATGAWTGHVNDIAYWTTQNLGTAGWDFWTPTNGWFVFNVADASFYYFTSGAWTLFNPGGQISTNGTGYFIGPGIMDPTALINTSVTNSSISTIANRIFVTQFVLPTSVTVRKISYAFNSQNANTANFGIYSSAGALLIDSGPFDTNQSIATPQTRTITAVKLAGGTGYYLAQSASDSAVKGLAMQTGLNTGIAEMLNNASTKYGIAANSTSGGVMPSTLGTITAATISTGLLICLPVFEP